MKRKLAVLVAAGLVCLTFLGSPPPTKADLCETMYGCRLRRAIDTADCICDSALRSCTICCLDNSGCCWSGTGGTGYFCTS